MFTRKHYVAIAKVVAELHANPPVSDEIAGREMLVATVDALVEVFAEDNGEFDSARFVKACGLGK